MKSFRFILKGFLWLSLVLVLLFAVTSIVVYQFKDRIIAAIVSELNKELNTKVEVAKIDIAFWETFPNVSVAFYKIKMKGSLLGEATSLMTADKLFLSFNIFDLYNGKYNISKTTIENADLHLIIREDGENNFTIFNKKVDSSDTSSVALDLKEIVLKRVNFLFENRINHQSYDLFCSQGEADFSSKQGSWGVTLGGDFFVHKIVVDHHHYLASKNLELNARIEFDKHSHYYKIQPSTILIGQSLFNVDGKFGVNSGQDIQVSLLGKQTSIQTILGLLPSDITSPFAVYKSSGDIYFKGTIRGKVDSRFAPAAMFTFGCSNASFWHPDLNKKITNISFKGEYSNGRKSAGEVSFLKLENLKGSIDGRVFNSDLQVKDFTNPYIKFNFNGSMDLASLKNVFKSEAFQSVGGELKTDLFFEGYKKHLDHRNTLHKVKSYGNLQITNCHFKTKNNAYQVKNLNTQFSFDNEAIYLHELTANAQGQDIMLKGNLYHYLMYLAGTSKDLDGELQLEADYLDLDKFLLEPVTQDTKSEEKEKNIIPDEGRFVFQCDVKKIAYKKFVSRNVKGRVVLHRKVLSGNNLSLKAAGGSFKVDGKMDFTNENAPIFTGKAKCAEVKVDSVLYLFDNFGQDFLTYDHLKGLMTINADLYVPLNDNNKIKTKQLKALLEVNIKNGELNNFEPMQKLSRFLDAKELSNIRFKELKNTIRVENETIYIPDMEIKSNLNTVGILGTQTFDGNMDYKVRISLKNYKKKDPDEVFGAIKEEGVNTTLFLLIKGTSENPKISYDKQAVKDKIKDGWKKEKEEFKSIFKTNSPIQQPKNKSVEVNEEEEISIE